MECLTSSLQPIDWSGRDNYSKKIQEIEKLRLKLQTVLARYADSEIARDAVQDMIEKLLRLTDEKKIENLEGWCFKVSLNALKKEIYLKKTMIEISDSISELIIPAPSDCEMDEDRFEKLKRAWGYIKKYERDAFIVAQLHYYYGYSFEQIATVQINNGNPISANGLYKLMKRAFESARKYVQAMDTRSALGLPQPIIKRKPKSRLISYRTLFLLSNIESEMTLYDS